MHIERVQVEEGFWDGLDIESTPGLNVIIGARGTGSLKRKRTIARSSRFIVVSVLLFQRTRPWSKSPSTPSVARGTGRCMAAWVVPMARRSMAFHATATGIDPAR